jgi:hypothetical protein
MNMAIYVSKNPDLIPKIRIRNTADLCDKSFKNSQ